jgi:3'(2'), 5'-bisphosphate nucleotidase
VTKVTNKKLQGDMKELLVHAIDAARKAGKAIIEVYTSDFAVEHKDDKSPLTLADKRAHDIIVKTLSAFDSSIPILSEEGKDIPYEARKNFEYFWLVDPLDGTKEFVKRNGEFTVNIALIRRDRPILGVIYVPVTDTLYYGHENAGSFMKKNGLTIKLPAQSNREHFTIVGSRSHASQELADFVEEMRKKHKEVDFISAGSSLKFCLVAEGKADIYPRLGPTMEWDTAAGQAIAEETGCTVLQWKSKEPLRYNKENLLNPWFTVSTKN